MEKNNIPEAIGAIVSLAGVVVMAGWFLGIGALKSILPASVSMKFSTALSFVLCGVMLYFLARFQKKERDPAIIIISAISMSVLLIAASLLASTIIGVSTGVEEMFVKDLTNATGTVMPGRPSIATMVSFILIAMSGILTVINVRQLSKITAVFGPIVAMIGSAAISGYIINQPLLYFAVSGVSSAMAVHTAVLFVFLGVGLSLTKKK